MGTYQSTRITLETPPKVPDFTWKKDDGSAAVGPGDITLSVADGTVTGDATGALGPQKVSGVLGDSVLRFDLLPADPTQPLSMTGSGMGEVKDGELVGSVRLSGPKGVEVREVSFTLKPTR